jgi:signal recognition particle subunit SRP54
MASQKRGPMAGLAQAMGFGGGMPSPEQMKALAEKMPGGMPGGLPGAPGGLPQGMPGLPSNFPGTMPGGLSGGLSGLGPKIPGLGGFPGLGKKK